MKNIIIAILWVSLGLGSFYYNLKVYNPVPRTGVEVFVGSLAFVAAAPVISLITLGIILDVNNCVVNCGGE